MTYARLASDAGTSGAASAGVSGDVSAKLGVHPHQGGPVLRQHPGRAPVATTTGSAASAMIHPSRSAG